MCLQDFQMARSMRYQTYDASAADVSLPANPLRLRLIVACNGSVAQVAAQGGTSPSLKNLGFVGYVDSGGIVTDGRTEVFRVEDYGTMLNGDLFIHNASGAGVVTVTEVVALPALDGLISGGR